MRLTRIPRARTPSNIVSERRHPSGPEFYPYIGNRTDVRLLNRMMTSALRHQVGSDTL